MADIKYYDVIKRPVITEKSMAAMGEKKYTFLVHPEANKAQIKEAVEKMFDGTKVKSVNTMNLDGKKKRRGMVVGKTAKSKKAIVALTEDSKNGSSRVLIDSLRFVRVHLGSLLPRSRYTLSSLHKTGLTCKHDDLLLLNPWHSEYREYTHSKA